MIYEDIRFEIIDAVAIIELHRPEHLNTYSMKMDDSGDVRRGDKGAEGGRRFWKP